MTRRDRRRSHATESPRARRIRQAAEREAEWRARGIDPFAGDGGRTTPNRRARTARRPPRLKRIVAAVLTLVLVAVVGASYLLWQRVSAFNTAVSSAPSASSSL